jgi:hypothetical protein
MVNEKAMPNEALAQFASDRAPDGACKHVIATWLYRRGTVLATERLKQLDVPHSVSQILSEAPASANVYLTIQCRKVQLSLRDHNENALLTWMDLVLNRFPKETPESTTPPEGWCPVHQVQMKRYSNQKGSWWSRFLR